MDIIIPGYESLQPHSRSSFYDYHDNTFGLVSRVAYLLGVPKHIFENENESPDMEVYQQLDQNKNARIIRNLCVIRTALERNYKEIYNRMRYDLKNLHNLPELIPQDSLTALENDGISLIRANTPPSEYIKLINRTICDRVNNIKNLFPVWIEWNYIREMFIMPNGLTDAGIKAAANEYYAKRSGYPYGVYVNWPSADNGNILYNDSKFVKLLYESHEDCFSDMSKVTDAGVMTKNEIYDFLDTAEKVTIVVDCENSDPYKLYAMLKNLNEQALLDRINKIILYDDVHTTTAWNLLNEFTRIPVEYILTERVKQQKSLVDFKLTVGVCREYYENHTDAFILASSDSDFWGLISAMPELKFYVLVESEKCGPDIKKALEFGGYSYAYIDNFCTGNSYRFKEHAMLDYITGRLNTECAFNIRSILSDALHATRAGLSETEERQFYDRYLKTMKLTISKEGNVAIGIGA